MPTKSHGLWRTWQGSTERPRLNPKIGFKGPVGQRIIKIFRSRDEVVGRFDDAFLRRVAYQRLGLASPLVRNGDDQRRTTRGLA